MEESSIQQEATLEDKAEALLANFRADYLAAVKRYSTSGGVAENDLDIAFLKVVLLLTVENYDIKRFDKCKEIYDNLRHF